MSKLIVILEWLKVKLAEKTTWAAIAAAVAFFGGILPEAWLASLQDFLPALVTFVLFIINEKKKK